MRKTVRMGMLVALVMLGVGVWTAAQDKPEVVEVTGILVKVSAVGADTTGWELHFPNAMDIGGEMMKGPNMDGKTHTNQKGAELQSTAKTDVNRAPVNADSSANAHASEGRRASENTSATHETT